MAEQGEQVIILGRFRVEGVISRGSFGVVVKAFDMRLKRLVAIKRLNVADSPDPDTARVLAHRFAREAQAFGRVRSHPNIVTVYDFAQDSVTGISYLILEYVAGDTLASRLERGALPLAQALRLCQDYARGLHAAHEVDLVHRDVKPANLFIADDGRGQVGDFGIAQIDDGLSRRTYMTREHPGTPRYMSPEQEQSTAYLRPQSDQYSLGLVLFEMLTGVSFKRVGPREVERRLAEFPPEVGALVRQMTMPNPDDRFPTLEDAVRAIGTIEWALGPQAQYPSPSAPYPAVVAGAVESVPAITPLPSVFPTPTPTPAPPLAVTSVAAVPDVASKPDLAAWVAAQDAPVAPPPLLGFRSFAPYRRRRLAVAAVALVVLLIAGAGTLAASASRQRERGSGMAVVGVSPSPTPLVTATVPAASVVAVASSTPPATVPPTATLALPTATLLAPTLVPVVVPTPLPPTPTATALPVIGVFGFGTVATGREQVAPEDVVAEFTAGQEVFVFVNFDGARPGVDSFELILTRDDVPQPAMPMPIGKPAGFISLSLGALPSGDYRAEVRRGGAAIFAPWSFRVSAPTPPPTAVPRPPSNVPAPTPTPRPVAPAPTPTPAPVAPAPTPTPRPVVVPTTAPVPTPTPGKPTPVPGSG